MRKELLKVVVTRKLPTQVEKRMSELFNTKFRDPDLPMSKEELISAAQSADVLVTSLGDKIDEEILTQGGCTLKLIANYGAGFDHIEIKTALKNNILVSNTPDVISNDTADLTMTLILGIHRRISEGLKLITLGNWSGWAPTSLLGKRLFGRQLGILGLGRIGQAVAERAKSFGLQINYHNRNKLHPKIEKIYNAKYWKNLDDMLRSIDILSIHVPHTPSTFHLINARRLKLMHKESFIVNTARGEIIDENALTRMLRSNDIMGAGLDVYQNSRSINPRLKQLKNVMLLPHMGSATHESRIEMGEKVILNIKTFDDGHQPPNLILPGML